VFAPDAGPRSVTDETDVFVQTPSHGSFASACFVISASDLSDVFIQVTTNSSFGGGCFVVPTADFSVSKDLQTAALHTKLTSATPSCYPGTPNVPLPLNLDVTWKGIGVVTTGQDRNSSRCQDYKTDTTLNSLDGNATASATVGGLSGSGSTDSFSGAPGSTHTSDSTQDVKGVPTPACNILF
jgi:hypothetical protein